MSRAHDTGAATGSVAGDRALPLPAGDPSALRVAARSIERVASRARATTTLRGTLGPRLRAVWTGAAATAAEAEATLLGRRSRDVVDALPAAARSLLAYAAAVDHAVARVRSLQRQWDALDDQHARALAAVSMIPDPAGVLAARVERLEEERRVGRARLARSHEREVDVLRAAARRCAQVICSLTESTLPWATPARAADVRAAVTGGLWFADGAAAAGASRDAALIDAAFLGRWGAPSPAGVQGSPDEVLGDAPIAAVVRRLREHADDPVYAQALLDALGYDGVARLATEAVAEGSSARVDTVRALLGTLGSLVVTAVQQTPPTGTDPRIRAELASGSALLADDLVSAMGAVHTSASGRTRASGSWLLGQLLAGARAAGDDRPLPPRLVRRAVAAAATAEIAETRDADADLRHGTTLSPDGDAAFASWFDDPGLTGDALHVLVREVGGDPAEQVALLAERLPDAAVAERAPTNSRGDRLTVAEHLVRRWITHEANGIESHPDVRLATDGDLARLLPSLSAVASAQTAELRGRVMLEVARTSSHAMGEASTTRIYSRSTAPVEGLVVDWFSASRHNVDRTIAAPHFTPGASAYAAVTPGGMQPLLDAHELASVVGALAVDSGTGLHARDPAAPYDRLVETELTETGRSAATGGGVGPDIARLGFLDRAASAALVAVARRQDGHNVAAWQALAEAKDVAVTLQTEKVAGLGTVAAAYASNGTMRTALDDFFIALVRSDVELCQTERDEARRAALVQRIGAISRIGSSASISSSLALGAGRAPAVPTAESLRAARAAEIRAAWDALGDDRAQRVIEDARRRGTASGNHPDRLHVAQGRNGPLPEFEQLPTGRSRGVRTVPDEATLRDLFVRLTHDASPRERRDYDGTWYERPDGIEVGLRNDSRSGGATIDLRYPDDQTRKVHVQ